MKLSEIKAKTPTEKQVIRAWLTQYCMNSVTKVMRDITEMQQNGWGTAVSDSLHLKAVTVGEEFPTPPLRMNNFTDMGHVSLILNSFDLTNLNFDWVDSCVSMGLSCNNGGTFGGILNNTALFDGVKNLKYLNVWATKGDNIGSIIPYINDKIMFQLGINSAAGDSMTRDLYVSTLWTNGDHILQVQGKNYSFKDVFELQDILIEHGYEDLV